MKYKGKGKKMKTEVKKSKKRCLGLLLTTILTFSLILPVRIFAETDSGFSIDPVAPAVERIQGIDRYETAVRISQQSGVKSEYAILAAGMNNNLVDALTVAPLASKKKAPVLFTEGDHLSIFTEKELNRLGTKTVYLTSGEGVISRAVKDKLKEMGIGIIDLGGANRYETAVNIAKELEKTGQAKTVIIASAYSNADALAAAPIAAAEGWPILIADQNKLHPSVSTYLKSLGEIKIYVIGGTEVIRDTVTNDLTNPVRIAGTNRFATNIAVLTRFQDKLNFTDGIYLADGQDSHLIDCLAATPFIAAGRAPLILTNNQNIIPDTREYLEAKIDIPRITVIGGTGSISQDMLTKINNMLTAVNYVQKEAVLGSTNENSKQNFTQNILLGAENIKLQNAVLDKNLYLKAHNCTIKNIQVAGNIYIDPGENGSAHLDKVTASKIIVLSGASESIHLTATSAGHLIIAASEGSGVRVVTGEMTTIGSTTIQSYAILDNQGGQIGTITVTNPAGGTPQVTLEGIFTEEVIVEGEADLTAAPGAVVPSVVINTAVPGQIVGLNGAFGNLNINSNTQVRVGDNSTIDSLTSSVNTSVTIPSSSTIGTFHGGNTGTTISGGGKVNGSNTPLTPGSSVSSGGGGSDSGGSDSSVAALALVNGVSFSDAAGIPNNGKTQITLGAPSVPGNTYRYKISDNNEAVPTPLAGADLSSWTAIANGDLITAANGKHIGVAEVNGSNQAVQFSDGTAVVGADEVAALALVNGVSFSDAAGIANNGKTQITLGAPSVPGNTYRYKISDNNEAVPTPAVGADLSSWTAIANGDLINAANGKHIGVAEVNGSNQAVQFSDGTAVVGVDEVAAPALANGVSFSDPAGIPNNGKTQITLGAPSAAGNTYRYKISDNNEAVPTPQAGADLSSWTAIANGDLITAANGKHIGVAEVNGSNQAVRFSDCTAVVGADEVAAPALANGISFSDPAGIANNGKTQITLGAPSVPGNTYRYKISDNNEAVPTPVVGANLSSWTAIANGGFITAANGKHIGVAEVNGSNQAVRFSDATAVVGADEVAAPALVNGVSFSDAAGIPNNGKTQITLGAPSAAWNTYRYKISDNNEAVPTPIVGADLSSWTAIANGGLITAANGKHIGVAEVNGSNQAVRFSDATAVVGADEVPLAAIDLLFANTIQGLWTFEGRNLVTTITNLNTGISGNSFRYKVSDNSGAAVPMPRLLEDLTTWTAVAAGDEIVALEGRHIGLAEVNSSGQAVGFSDALPVDGQNILISAPFVSSLTSGVTFADAEIVADTIISNNGKTRITLGSPSIPGNTFRYKISDNNDPVPTVGGNKYLGSWSPVANGALITVANGKHIGVAEVNSFNQAIRFSDGIAVVEDDSKAPTSFRIFGLQDARLSSPINELTVETLLAGLPSGHSYRYIISDNTVATPNLGDDLSSWTPTDNQYEIITSPGKHIGIAHVDQNNKAVAFKDFLAQRDPDYDIYGGWVYYR